VNTITVLIQVFLTGRLMKWFGVGITLVLMPLFECSWICRDRFRADSHRPCDFSDFATSRRLRSTSTSARSSFHGLAARGQIQSQEPHRHIRYRLGDQFGAWSYPLMRGLGLGLVGISWVAVPVGAVWCVLSIWLGRKQRQLAEAKPDQAAPLSGAAAPEAA